MNYQSLKTWFVGCCMAVAALGAGVAAAEPASKASDPHAVVQAVTDDVMAIVRGGEAALRDDPKAYYAKVRATLEPVVSFDFIARNVMASHWDNASAEQRRTFTETFTTSMVETFGKGMATFSDFKIRTLPADGPIGDAKRVEVVQEVATTDGTNRVSYTMAQNRTGEWKLINVVLNGVNLGRSFRDQFAQAMRQSGNDLDKAIADWAQKS